MTTELSRAGEHYGKTICLPPEKAMLPVSMLTQEEQECVNTVGLGWENRVEKAYAANSPVIATTVNKLVSKVTKEQVGTLTMDNGIVTLCLPTKKSRNCMVVGSGMDSLITARKTLDATGISAVD